jgi:hypothetical protein
VNRKTLITVGVVVAVVVLAVMILLILNKGKRSEPLVDLKPEEIKNVVMTPSATPTPLPKTNPFDVKTNPFKVRTNPFE